MKIAMNLQKDNANTYPGEVTFSQGLEGEWVFIEIDDPVREIAVKKEDFLRLCKFFLESP